jgi:hypothetical protein
MTIDNRQQNRIVLVEKKYNIAFDYIIVDTTLRLLTFKLRIAGTVYRLDLLGSVFSKNTKRNPELRKFLVENEIAIFDTLERMYNDGKDLNYKRVRVLRF